MKPFYTSMEGIERGLDPLTTNLVVAGKHRTAKTICLAVPPSLKAYGIPERARLFEVVRMPMIDQAVGEITCFQPDGKKDGGTYVTIHGTVTKIDPLERCACLTDEAKLPIDDILDVEI